MAERVAPVGAVEGGEVKAKKKYELVNVDELRPHPSHAKFDTQLSEDEIDRLAEDIRQNGLQVPIEVTPDRDVICGHQRLRALKKLGRTQVRAWVRHDLAEEGGACVEERMINDNLLRRQLDPLAKARYYRRLREISKSLPYEKQKRYGFGDSRDELAKEFNMSGRNIERLVKVLDAPRAVQDAVSANRLSLKAAGKVAGSETALQETIAKEIEAGEDPEAVVARHFPEKERTHVKVRDAKAAAIKAMRFILKDLGGRLGDVKTISPQDAEVLDRMAGLIAQVRKDATVWTEEQAKAARRQRLAALAATTRPGGHSVAPNGPAAEGQLAQGA